MPELPEVETVVKGLNKLVLNKKVIGKKVFLMILTQLKTS